jgi:hypothetical protein
MLICGRHDQAHGASGRTRRSQRLSGTYPDVITPVDAAGVRTAAEAELHVQDSARRDTANGIGLERHSILPRTRLTPHVRGRAMSAAAFDWLITGMIAW